MRVARRSFLASIDRLRSGGSGAAAAPSAGGRAAAHAQNASLLLFGIGRARPVSRALGTQGRGGFRRPYPHRHLSFHAAWRRPRAAFRPGARRLGRYRVGGAEPHARPLSQNRSVRAAVRAGEPSAGQFEGDRGLRRRKPGGRVSRSPSVVLLLPRSRRRARRPAPCRVSRSSGASSCMCQTALPTRRCAPSAGRPSPCRSPRCSWRSRGA